MGAIQTNHREHFVRQEAKNLLSGGGVQGARPNLLPGEMSQPSWRLVGGDGIKHDATPVWPKVFGDPAVKEGAVPGTADMGAGRVSPNPAPSPLLPVGAVRIFGFAKLPDLKNPAANIAFATTFVGHST